MPSQIRYAADMSRDIIDELQDDWSEERPDLDSEAMGIVLRIQALEKILGDQVAERLREHGLQWWQYDVLSALRRQGKPYRMAATELAEAGMLTSGAMTHRIDRLEQKALVRRLHDPQDRRRVLVELTSEGHERVENATEARFEIAAAAVDEILPDGILLDPRNDVAVERGQALLGLLLGQIEVGQHLETDLGLGNLATQPLQVDLELLEDHVHHLLEHRRELLGLDERLGDLGQGLEHPLPQADLLGDRARGPLQTVVLVELGQGPEVVVFCLAVLIAVGRTRATDLSRSGTGFPALL